MRNYTENVWAEVEPVTERAQSIGLERVIDQLADDRAPRLERVRQVRNRARRAERDETAAIGPIRFAAERIIAGNELTHVHYLQRGLIAAKAVGRVVVRDMAGTVIGFGTGFLVADGVLVTNAHVLTSPDEVANSSVEFRYELDADGSEITPVEFRLPGATEPIISRELDLTIAAVEPLSTDGQRLDEFGWLRLDPTPGKAVIGEYLTIIQHPGGERKQVCVRENKLLKYDANGPYVWYQTDTVGGSSGSPVFNNSWDVVALHHSAVPRTDVRNGRRVFLTRTGKVWDPSMGDDAIDWFANEGIRVSRIIEYLRAVWPTHPLTQRIVAAERPPIGIDHESNGAPMVSDNGVLRFNIPIEVRIGQSGMPTGVAQRPASTGSRRPIADRPPLEPILGERVEIDQTNYDRRNGYAEDFLGDKQIVPLPTIPRATLQAYGQSAQNGLRLKYYNYSVVFNKERRVAYYSACNVRSDLLRGSRDDDEDWAHDPRLGESEPPLEIDNTWYGQQRTFEADRRFNPFDRGHLTARNHLQWGRNEQEAKRNGDDSYHFTNCSPQHWQFNQNNRMNGLWFATEDEVLKLTEAKRLCVINGPVFNAPNSHREPDGQWRLDPGGERALDPVFGGVSVPKQFFKIIVWREEQHLRCVGFVVTQEGLLETVERLVWPDVDGEEASKPKGLTDGEAALYRLPISTIASLTGLKFGVLEDIPSPLTEELALEAQTIESIADLGREIARA